MSTTISTLGQVLIFWPYYYTIRPSIEWADSAHFFCFGQRPELGLPQAVPFSSDNVMEKGELLAKVSALGRRVLEQCGMELVDVELHRQRSGWFLRFTIDRPGGVSLDDCQSASQQLSVELDVEDIIPVAYTLEVSSPGLDRPLRTDADFIRFTGRLVVISTFEPVSGRRRFVGHLRSYREGVAWVVDEMGTEYAIPRAKIAKARLEVEI